MPLDRPVVFPLLPMTPEGACTCFLSRQGGKCSRPGHHPAVEWKELESGSPVPLPAPGAGYGVKTGARPRGSGIVVVDLDGEGAIDAWLELGGAEDTYTVQSARGLHLYFQHPGFFVSNSAKKLWKNLLEEGIDLRGDGGYVVGPGSPHRSGAVYTLVNDVPLAPLPDWLIDWLKAQPARAEVQPHPEDVAGEERARRREIYGSWLASDAPICRAGQGGDQVLFKVVQKGAYDLALPSEDVLELIAEVYDPRCEPPWGEELEERVLHKAHDAKTKSTRPREYLPTVEEETDWASVFEGNNGQKLDIAPELADTFGFKLKRGGWDIPPIPPNYLVENLLVEGKVSMIFAEPGAIKSWTAIDIAAAVSKGTAWLGERVTSKGVVLYVDFEDGEHEFHRRVSLLTGGEERADLVYTYAPGSISEKEWWVRLEKLVNALEITFVVIDTLAGATPGVDENDRNAADPLIYAGWFTEKTKSTVLVLHHANRSGDIRGTSAFKANVDTLFKLETVEEEEANGVKRSKLTCVKSGHKKVYPIHLELTDDGLTRYEPVKESVAEGEKEDKRTLTELQGDILLLIESEGPFASIEMLRTRVKARTAHVSAVLAELTASGEVYRSPEGWRRDSDGLRRARLKAVVGDWEKRGWGAKVLARLASVTPEFFERCRQEGRIVQATIGSDEDGFVWRDK